MAQSEEARAERDDEERREGKKDGGEEALPEQDQQQQQQQVEVEVHVPVVTATSPGGGRRKSVTINEDKPVTIEVKHPPQSAASSKLPVRSALKKPEDLQFVIRSADPIGQDTAVYEFNKYQMPMGDGSKPLKGISGSATRLERIVATYVARISVLLGRSSGRDKAASVIQYAAMFWGSQPFVNLTKIEDSDEAPWKKLEESMSNGRKVFRLGKWIKEYEKARVALTAPDSYLGVHPNKYSALVTRFLAVLMNSFSFWYYVFDNMIWAAQSNLINRYPRQEELRRSLLEAYPKLSYERYIELQNEHIKSLDQREQADQRVKRWKDLKNWSSLGRLIFAIVHCYIQIKSLRTEDARLRDRYADRIRRAEIQLSDALDEASTSSDESASTSGSARQLVRRYSDRSDSITSERGVPLRTPADLRAELSTRRKEVKDAVIEQQQELFGALCNLGILLNRLKFRFFRAFPLWVIGALGMTSGILGCLKNWPKFVPKPKANKVARRRSDSLDDEVRSVGSPISSPKFQQSSLPDPQTTINHLM
ncbi:Peroxisomal membrane protein 11-like [Hondaea fermentalgiana]|uniref:Peroxisomal membrane protein 11-like n=1 Tax=Hondaea fermentalgiana TaxID=2315210 RepID=A0A2R5GAA9_9STRA|nr:Peroxisomal membrane protein 11-like [Hondaea fermentalgiana]|eukprot:GBG24644.1 Peroxisomal membrane protein 11-like [Hondaea fermentalgiana]